jgi:transposase
MYVAVVPNRNSPPAILLREGYREGGKVKSRTLANLSDWKAERIEALKRALRGELDGLVGDADPTSDRIFGVLFVLKELADRLDITRALSRAPMGKLALFLVLARVATQGSRLSAVRWAEDHCVSEILGLDSVSEKQLYQALDWLTKHQERIEKKLYRAYAKKKGSPNMLVLYDVTSSYLEGECNELGQFGYCRDKKKGKKQIVIGLLTAADGEPLSVKVFEGNTSDPETVASQIEILKSRFAVEDVVFVGDRGMVKSKGKTALKESGFKYITALTNPQVRKLLKENILQPDLFDETVCDVEYRGLRLILRKNEKVRRKEEARREDKLRRLRELVQERNAFVSTSQRAQPEAGLRKLTNWTRRYKISSFVTLCLDHGQIVMSIDEQARADAGLLDGCHVLETDVSGEKMDAKTVDERYRSLQQVERNFRTLKTGFLEIRPVFVRKADRTRGHALVSMLALKIVREAQELLGKAIPSLGKNNFGLEDALGSLSRWCFQSYHTDTVAFLRLQKPDHRQHAILTTLGIHPPRNEFAASVGRRQIHNDHKFMK